MYPSVLRLSPLFLFAVLTFFLIVGNAGPAPRDWTVVEASGAIDIRDGGDNRLSATIGARLPAPFSVATGADGYLAIAHGSDRITVQPHARVAVPLPAASRSGVVTRVGQSAGSALYQVEHRVEDSFEVDTPYLVSVVKGTVFNIRVAGDAATVTLVEGRVLVHTPDTKSQLILQPGQAATGSKGGDKILLQDQQSLSSPAPGPITIAGAGDDSATATAAIGISAGASVPNQGSGETRRTVALGGPGLSGGIAGIDGAALVGTVGSLPAGGIGGAVSTGVGPGVVDGSVISSIGVDGTSIGFDSAIAGGATSIGIDLADPTTALTDVGGLLDGSLGGGVPIGLDAGIVGGALTTDPGIGTVDLGVNVGGTVTTDINVPVPPNPGDIVTTVTTPLL